MALIQNPTKIRRIASVTIVVAIFVQIINFFYYFNNSSGDQSTTVNSLIMYLCMAAVLGSIVFAILASRTNKQ